MNTLVAEEAGAGELGGALQLPRELVAEYTGELGMYRGEVGVHAFRNMESLGTNSGTHVGELGMYTGELGMYEGDAFRNMESLWANSGTEGLTSPRNKDPSRELGSCIEKDIVTARNKKRQFGLRWSS